MYHIYLDEGTGIVRVMQEDKGVIKPHGSFTTLQDFCNALSSNAQIQTPILPPSCFKMSTSENIVKVCLFYPGRKVDFKMTLNGLATTYNTYNIFVPNTVIIANLGVNKNDEKYQFQGASIYYTDSPLPTPNMKLYVPRLPNVYENANICFGRVSTQMGYNMESLFGIDAVYSMFFNNVANYDLFRGESIKGTKITSPDTYLDKLSELTEEQSKEVYFNKNNFVSILSGLLI